MDFHNLISKQGDIMMTEKVVLASALCRQFEIDEVFVEAVKNLGIMYEAGELLYLVFLVQERQLFLI